MEKKKLVCIHPTPDANENGVIRGYLSEDPTATPVRRYKTQTIVDGQGVTRPWYCVKPGTANAEALYEVPDNSVGCGEEWSP